MSKLQKSLTEKYDLSIREKSISREKLPKILANATDGRQRQRLSQQKQKSKTFGMEPSQHLKSTFTLKQRNSKSIIADSAKKLTITQQNQLLRRKLGQHRSSIKLKPITKQQIQSPTIKKRNKIIVQQKIQSGPPLFNKKVSSAQSSRTNLHSVANQIQFLLPQQTLKFILPVKLYKQQDLGPVSSIWWGVIDSLMISLQKLIKIKNMYQSPQKQKKSPQKNKDAIKSKQPETQKQKTKQNNKKTKNITGTVQSNTKASIQISKVYSALQQQINKNQQHFLKYFEDQSHQILIIQCLFYEKAIVYLLGTIKKWNHHQQHLYIHSMAHQFLPCIIQCRKLCIQILLQAVENDQQDNKIRKPKYIARQKKLIQISKFINMIRVQYQKYLNSLGSPHRYKNFQLPQILKQHNDLKNLQRKWRNIVFDIPLPPFLPIRQNRKNYLLIIQPLNILYKYHKKQQILQVDPYAQQFMKTVGAQFDIVFFTSSDKQSSLLNFLGILDKVQILSVFDKHYLTYKNAKPIKDIRKVGGGYSHRQILVIDEKLNSKFYVDCKYSVLLVDSFHTQTKIARVNGKLIKLGDHDDDYLKKLSIKIMNCAQKGGHWEQIIKQKHQRKKISN